MSNIMVRTQNGNVTPQRSMEVDPLRMARELLRWDPFAEMMPQTWQSVSSYVPSFEVKETKDGYVFRADVPGVKESDIEITRTGNRLTVSGKREAEKEEESDRYYAYERTYGDFSRSFTMPEGIDLDHAAADLTSGVLTISIPKTEQAKPKKISLKGLFQKH